MKKHLAFLLALVMTMSLCACGGNTSSSANSEASNSKEPETPKYNIGDTVSTDIWDFTLNDVALSIYASATNDGTFATPIEKSDGGIFVASVGHSLTCLTFKVKNKDRSSLSIGDGGSRDWGLGTLSIVSGNDEYPIKGFDLNNKDGSGGLRMDRGTINGKKADSCNYIMKDSQTIDVQIVGIISAEKDNLADTCSFKVGIPNSSGKVEYFEYAISK